MGDAKAELEKIIESGRIALRKDGATAESVATALVEAVEYEAAKKVAAPKAIELTPDLLKALSALPGVFGRQQVTEIRQLTEAELKALGEEQLVIEEITKPLTTRREAIKEIVRNHMDEQARAQGKVTEDTLVDAKGHLVVAAPKQPEQVEIPGTDTVWSREFRKGSVDIEPSRLLDMYEAGEIDRKTYLAFTREVRVFDEHKAMAAMAKDPSLLRVFRRLIKRGRPSTALGLRKK